MYQLSQLSLQTGFWSFVTIWTMSRAGMPFLFVPINVMAFAYVPREKTNSATGMINLTRNMGGSVGISLVTAAQSHMAQVTQSSLAGHVTSLNPIYASRLQHLQSALQVTGSSSTQAAQQAQALLYGEMLRQSAMVAYVDVFRVLAWVCVGLIPLMFFMKPIKHGGGAPPVH